MQSVSAVVLQLYISFTNKFFQESVGIGTFSTVNQKSMYNSESTPPLFFFLRLFCDFFSYTFSADGIEVITALLSAQNLKEQMFNTKAHIQSKYPLLPPVTNFFF